MLGKIIFTGTSLMLILLCYQCRLAEAQEYPVKPIEVIVGLLRGGTDMIARALRMWPIICGEPCGHQ